jgi:hypothetical protein
VRPNDNIRFKAITLEEAFKAIAVTDAMIDTLTALARGDTTLEAAEAALANLKPEVPAMPATAPVLVKQEATEGRPGLLVRLAGDRYNNVTGAVVAIVEVLVPHVSSVESWCCVVHFGSSCSEAGGY